jgi:hypothetical protein
MALSFVHASFLMGVVLDRLRRSGHLPAAFISRHSYFLASRTRGVLSHLICWSNASHAVSTDNTIILAPQAIILENPGHGEFRLSIAFEF